MPKHLIQVEENTSANIIATGDANNAVPGQFYYATDTEKYFFGKQDGSVQGPIPSDAGNFHNYGDFNNDTHAAGNGVPVGGYYTLTEASGFEGMVKQRKS